MKCMFNPEIECTVYDILEDVVERPDPYLILQHACPLCPHRPFPERPFPERPLPERPKRRLKKK